MQVSTFELLVKSQLPKDVPNPPIPLLQKLSRTVIQGYFLTIANVTEDNVVVSLEFTSVTPTVDIAKTIAFLDVTGVNIIGDLTPDTTPGKATFTIELPANDTCLFILQPDIVKENGKLLEDTDFEVRGYVDINLEGAISPAGAARRAQLLLTAEHRGTFFNSELVDNPNADLRLDQFISVLPLATGASLYTLRRRENPKSLSPV